MSKHVKYVPKHRAPAAPSALTRAPRTALRTTVLLTSVAAAATGGAVATGVATGAAVPTAAIDLSDAAADVQGAADGALQADAAAAAETDVEERGQVVSRSADRRAEADPAKEATLVETDRPAVVESESLSDSDPRDIARALLPEFGFSSDQFSCLDSLWIKESNWSTTADNPTSSAYGIPQALPGSKMSSAGADWATNPVTQIRWGLGYIQDRYGSPCSAWGHSQSVGWY